MKCMVAALSLLLVVAQLALARPPQAPKPPQAPPVQVTDTEMRPATKPKAGLNCGCLDGGECACGRNCLCSELAKKTARPDAAYALARARSIREGKPLVVCVGGGADCCEASGDYIRYTCDSFPALGLTRGVVVAVPRDGELYRVAQLPLGCTLAQILTAVYPPAPAPAPVYAAPPMQFAPAPMFFGGSGFGGGGRRGGGC